MEKFTLKFQVCNEKATFGWDAALRIIEAAYDRPVLKLTQLDQGKIKKLKVHAGTLVKFVMPKKRSTAGDA